MLAISLRPGITRNSKHLLAGTSLGFDYMKQGKYISGDERGGFKVAKVNLPLSDRKLRLFLEGKEDWLEEGLLVLAKKKIKEEGLRRFFHSSRRRCTTKLCATICRNSGTAELLRLCTNASMGEWCSHAPTKFCGAQCRLCGAIGTSSSTTTKCPPLEDTLQETCKLLQPSKPMQTKWVKEMQTSLMSFDTFT
jgi:hypothetical protein